MIAPFFNKTDVYRLKITETWLTFFRPHIFPECFWLSASYLWIAVLLTAVRFLRRHIAVKFLRRHIAVWFLRLWMILRLDCCCWKIVFAKFMKRRMTLFVMRCTIWCHLYNLKHAKNTHGGVLLKPATLLKVTLLHGCFSRVLNCTNDTKSRKASLYED